MINKKTFFVFILASMFFLNGCGLATEKTNINPELPNTFSMTSDQAKQIGLPPVDFELQYGEIDKEYSLLPDPSGANYADLVLNNAQGEFMEELAVGYLNGTAGPVPEEFLTELLKKIKTQFQNGFSNIEFFQVGKAEFMNEDRYVIQAKIIITDETEGDPGTYLLLFVLYPHPEGGNGVSFILQANQATSEITTFEDFDSLEKGQIGKILSTFKFSSR